MAMTLEEYAVKRIEALEMKNDKLIAENTAKTETIEGLYEELDFLKGLFELDRKENGEISHFSAMVWSFDRKEFPRIAEILGIDISKPKEESHEEALQAE